MLILRKNGRKLIVVGVWRERGVVRVSIRGRRYIDTPAWDLARRQSEAGAPGSPPQLHATSRQAVADGREGTEASPCAAKRMSTSRKLPIRPLGRNTHHVTAMRETENPAHLGVCTHCNTRKGAHRGHNKDWERNNWVW